MKPNEMFENNKNKYLAIMIICFLYAGFSIILFGSQAYNYFWKTEVVGTPSFEDMNNQNMDVDKFNDKNRFNKNGARMEAMKEMKDPFVFFSSPISLTFLLGGIVALMAGFAIFSLVRKKEIKIIREQTTDNLLLPDEKAVIDALKNSNYEMTQTKIVKETGLNKVQVHRVVKRLESKGLLNKHEYGLTNKIILKKEYFEWIILIHRLTAIFLACPHLKEEEQKKESAWRDNKLKQSR